LEGETYSIKTILLMCFLVSSWIH